MLLSHAPLLTAGYVQDDHVAVEGNAVVAAGNIAAIWGGSYWQGTKGGDASLYRPVTVASYALERAIAGGTRPSISHAVNLLLHAIVSWLVFSIATACGVAPRPAMLGALLFAVAPDASEAVANVVGRAEVLAALFALGAVRLALVADSRAAAWAAAACVFLAGASKETGMVALPLVAVASLSARTWLEISGRLAPSLLAFSLLTVVRTFALEAFFPPQVVPVIDNPLVAESAGVRIATAFALVVRSARVVLFPVGLANDYSGGSIPIERSLASLRPLAGVAIVGGLAALATRGRTLALFVAITLLPYLLVSNLLVPVGAIFAERFLYLPVAGVCLLAAVAIDRLGRRGQAVALAVIAIAGALMVARSLDWKDDRTIFTATARHNPKSPRAAYWLATLAAEAGRPDEAIRWLDAAQRAWPDFAPPWYYRGVILAQRGDLDAAEAAFREAVRVDPSWGSARLGLALVLHRRGEREEAIRAARRATLLDPQDARAAAELGHLYYEASRLDDAAAAYGRAVALGRIDLAPRLRELQRLRAPVSPTPAPGSAPPP